MRQFGFLVGRHDMVTPTDYTGGSRRGQNDRYLAAVPQRRGQAVHRQLNTAPDLVTLVT